MSNIKSVYTEEELNNYNVYTFSDIHGDIMGLINILVVNIGILTNYSYNYVNTELTKSIDLINNDNKIIVNDYDPLLGMKIVDKIKEKSIIVIVGDILDSMRPDFTYMDGNKRYGEYIFEEIKILLLINELINNGCIIIKLRGNHEIMNTKECGSRDTNYVTDFAKENNINVNGIPILRNNLFIKNNAGHILLSYGGLFNIVKLGTYIFCHGGIYGLIKHNINDDDIIDKINNIDSKDMKEIICSNNGILWDRRFGLPEILDKVYINENAYNSYYNALDNSFKKISKEPVTCLIIGHCPQISNNFINETFCHIKNIYNDKLIISQDPVHIGYQHLYINDLDTDKSKRCNTAVFGITVGCADKINFSDNIEEKKVQCVSPKVIRLDHSLSRAFDDNNMYENLKNDNINLDKFTKLFISRMPQVLKISFKNNTIEHYIIRTLSYINQKFQIRNFNDYSIYSKLHNYIYYEWNNYNININKNKYKKYKLTTPY